MIMIYPVVMVVAGIWIYVDSSMRTGNSCFWASFAFACPFLGVPIYYMVLITAELRNSRGPGKQEREERERIEAQRKQFVIQGSIEREKDYNEAMHGGGTLFGETPGMGKQLGGIKYYTDHRAEELIESKDYDSAKAYLEDMLQIARKDQNTDAIETYRYYLNQLPESK